jgi:hypothetical protein
MNLSKKFLHSSEEKSEAASSWKLWSRKELSNKPIRSEKEVGF